MDIARAIKLKDVPLTLDGLKIAEKIMETALNNANLRGPTEVTAFEGELYGKKIRVSIVEKEENVRLCGPAFSNEVVIYQGSVLGVPKTDKWSHVFEHGFSTGIRYIDSFAHMAARRIEEAVAMDEGEVEVRVRMVESLTDINLTLQDNIRRYIISTGGKIDVRGPMFVAVRLEVE
jgi:O-phosphoseryl-tRNA synthetase